MNKRPIIESANIVIHNILKSVYYGICDELYNIGILVQLICPVVISILCGDYISMFVCSFLFLFASHVLKETHRTVNKKEHSGIPIYSSRLTQIDDNGFIYIPDNKMQEALTYLYEIEEYTKRMYKVKR